MTGNTVGTEAVDRYLDRLRAELADLPAHELADVLDDITPHLDDLARAGVTHAGLVAEVGAPAAYAAELRAAAGYPPRAADTAVRRPRLLLLRLVIGTLTALHLGLYSDSVLYHTSKYVLWGSAVLLLVCARPLSGGDPSVAPIGSLPVVRALRTFRPSTPTADYLRSLLPGWFVVSAVLAALGLHQLCDRGDWGGFVVVLAPIALALLAVVAGQRSLRDRRWLWFSLPVSAYAVGIGVHLLDHPVRFLLPATMHA